jgi:hypothetical protein
MAFPLHEMLPSHFAKCRAVPQGSAASERWEYDVHRWLTEQEKVAEGVKDDGDSDDAFEPKKEPKKNSPRQTGAPLLLRFRSLDKTLMPLSALGIRSALANMSSSYKIHQKLEKEKKIMGEDVARQEQQRAEIEAKEHQAALLDLITSQLRLEDST